MVLPILDRLKQHIADEQRGTFMGQDLPPVAPGGMDLMPRLGIGVANLLGLLGEAGQDAGRVSTGATQVLAARSAPGVGPFGLLRSLATNLPGGAGQTARDMMANANRGWEESDPNQTIFQRLMHANDVGAYGHPYAQGAINAAMDPTNLLALAGPVAESARAGSAIQRLAQAAHFYNEWNALGLDKLAGMGGGALLKRIGVATEDGLTPATRAFLRDRVAGAGLGAATGGVNAQIANSMTPGDQGDADRMKAALLVGALGGGALGGRRIQQGLPEALGGRLGGEGGVVARQIAQQEGGGLFSRATRDNVLAALNDEFTSNGVGVGPFAGGQPNLRDISPELTDYLRQFIRDPENFSVLQRETKTKPASFAPFDPERFRREAVENVPAQLYSRFASSGWPQIQNGEMTPDRFIGALLPTRFSIRRGALKGSVPTKLGEAGYENLLPTVYQSVVRGGEDAGGIRPEDLTAYLTLHTDQGRNLARAIRDQDAAGVLRALDDFREVWPGSIMEGDQQTLVSANQQLPKIIDYINNAGRTGSTPGDIVQDFVEGGIGIPRIAGLGEGKVPFLFNQLGAGSQNPTFDSQVIKRLVEGATPRDYRNFLRALYPDDLIPGIDDGMRHHLFWDSVKTDKLGRGGQTPHTGLAEIDAFTREGNAFAGVSPSGLGAQVGSLRDRIAQAGKARNLDAFMADAHPMLKNEDGTPKVFYHGTLSGNFDQFNVPTESGDFGHGAYFSEDPKYASMYASGSERQFGGSDNRVPVGEAGPNVKPVYVNLKNPYIWGENPQVDAVMASGVGKEGLRDKLMAQGYDGVIAPKSLYFGSQGNPNAIEEMVVFDPARSVKSATGNVGTYDPSNPSLLRSGLNPQGLADAVRARFPQAERWVDPGNVPPLKPERPVLSENEQRYVQTLVDHLDARAADNIDQLKGYAEDHWRTAAGDAYDPEKFATFWDDLVAQVEGMKVLETGLGDAGNIRRIIKSGLGFMNGYEVEAAGVGKRGTNLVGRKADALATPGRARYVLQDILDRTADPKSDAWFEQVYADAAAKLKASGLKAIKPNNMSTTQQVDAVATALGMDPSDLMAQFKEEAKAQAGDFLARESRAKELGGLGNPLEQLNGGAKASRYMYASVTEGQPAGQKQSGTIRLIWDPATPRTTTLTHDYMLAGNEVERIHKTTAPGVKRLWGDVTANPDMPIEPVGDTGRSVTTSPLLVGPKAESAARAAMMMISAPQKIVDEAMRGDPQAAAALLLRGGQDQASSGTMRTTAIQPALTRTESLILDPDIKNVKAVVIHGGSENVIRENLAETRRMLKQMGREDIPVYVVRGEEGQLPNVLPPDVSAGRAGFVDRYPQLRPQIAGKIDEATGVNEQLNGLTDFGAGLSPGAVGRAFSQAGAAPVAGAALGAGVGFTTDGEDRQRGALKGAGAGAIGGLAFAHLAPEVGRAVATAYRTATPGVVDNTIMTPKALSIAHRMGVAAQQQGDQQVGAKLSELPRQVDDAWRAQVVNTFRGLALDASSLWLLVKDFGRDYGVDRPQVKRTLGQLVDHFDDPDPLDRLGDLGTTLKDWDLGAFVDESTGLDKTLGAGYSQSDIGTNKMSTPQRFLTGAALSFTNLKEAMVPVVGPVIGGIRQVYAPYIDAAYHTLNGFQQAAPRIAFWDAALRRDLPQAADRFAATLAPTGIDLSPLFAAGKPVGAGEVGKYLATKYKGLTADEVGQISKLYQDELTTTAMESADRIAHIFGDFRDKNAKPWKTFLGRVFPFSRYAMEYAPVVLEMAKRHPLIAGAALAGTLASGYAVAQNGEAPWNTGTIPITTETPGLGALARLRLGGQSGTVRVDPLKNFEGPISGQTLAMDAGLPTDTVYDKAKGLIGKVGFSPHPVLDSLASLVGATNRDPQPASRTANIEQAAELIPGMPMVPSIQGAFNAVKGGITGQPVKDSDPVARRYAELVYEQTGRPMSDNRNLDYLERMGDVEDPLWARARQEVRLANLVGSLTSNLTPITNTATGAGAERVSQGYAKRLTDQQIQQLADRDPTAATVALYERNIADRFNPVTETYRGASTLERDRAVIKNWGPFGNNPAVRQVLLDQQRKDLKRKDR